MTTTLPPEAPICILGAGPQALALALHLERAQPDLAEATVVLDPAGAWMSTWNDQFARLDIDVLRSPIVHHPAPDVDALWSYVDHHGLPQSGLPYDPPMSASFGQFCDDLIDEAGLPTPVGAKPFRIKPQTDGKLGVDTGIGSIVTDHLVVACNPHRRVVPDWAWELCGQRSTLLEHANDVDLRTLSDLDGKSVAVIGGGLTAAHLALGATDRGASVHLISRRPLRERAFDTDPGWLGPKYLAGFEGCDEPSQRFDMARTARGGGTMPPWIHQLLRSSDVHIHENVSVTTADADRTLGLSNGDSLCADRVWLATGTTPDLRALRSLQPLLLDIALIDGLPITPDDLRVGLHPVYVTGRLATHSLGPAAGNLWGARMAARRITRAITGIDVDNMCSVSAAD